MSLTLAMVLAGCGGSAETQVSPKSGATNTIDATPLPSKEMVRWLWTFTAT
jgi:hypothetical protein